LSDYGDLLDFMKQISSASIRGIDSRDVSEVTTAAKQFIISNEDTTQYARATGMSIWLPTDQYTYSENSTRYKGLKFNAATGWGEALDFMLQGSSFHLN